MKFFHALSISNKLLVILLPVLLLSFVLLGQITTRKVKASLREETVRQLNSTVTSPSDMVAIANKSINRDADAKMNDLRQHYLGKFALEPGKSMRIGALEAPVLSFNGGQPRRRRGGPVQPAERGFRGDGIRAQLAA